MPAYADSCTNASIDDKTAMMCENHSPEFVFSVVVLEPQSPSRCHQGPAYIPAERAMGFDEMRAAQDGPQRSNVATVRFLAPQLGLETVIDFARVVKPDEETQAGNVDAR